MSELNIMDHPLIQSKLAHLRCADTNRKEFRELVNETASLLCYEATRDMPLQKVEVTTPLGKAEGSTLGVEICVVPILRAGLGMIDGILKMLPTAKVGHIGLYRDPNTFMPVEYFCKVPKDSEHTEIFVVDTMMATGGTASAAIQFLKERGFKKIKFICLICSPTGVQKLQADHDDVDIYCAAMDRQVNEDGYIVPGLGDAGDRMFGTK
jgi:uracil phosphoribosyltransferase